MPTAGLALGALALAAGLVPLVIRIARRTGFLDLPGPRKIHAAPMPYGGGFAVAAAFFAALATALALGLPLLAPKPLLIFALGSLVMLALGAVDDRRRLSPRVKLLVQTIAATGVAAGGERLEIFNAGPWIGGAVTVLWIVAVTNAFNLLDHMDGLSGGTAAIALGAFLVVALQTGQPGMATAVAALLGACAGFLLWNFPPAKIFLGDAGSLFIGFWLACLTISFTFYREKFLLYTYGVPVAVLAVPLFDTASVMFIRLRNRRPLFEGDTNHLAHRLAALGMSKRLAVLTIYALALAAGTASVLLYHVTPAGAGLVFVLLALIFGIMTLLEAAGRARKEPAP